MTQAINGEAEVGFADGLSGAWRTLRKPTQTRPDLLRVPQLLGEAPGAGAAELSVPPGHLLLPEPLQGLPAVCWNRAWLGHRVGPERRLSDASLCEAERLLLDLQDSNVFHWSVRPPAFGVSRRV